MQAQCDSLGIDIDKLLPPEAVEEAEAEHGDDLFEVWPEHWDAVQMLMACDTQWTVHLAAKGLYYQGLDFGKAGAIAEWMGIEKSPVLFRQLRILQDEAKKLLNHRN